MLLFKKKIKLSGIGSCKEVFVQIKEAAVELGRPLTLQDLLSMFPEVELEALRELMDEFYDFDSLVSPTGGGGTKWWEWFVPAALTK